MGSCAETWTKRVHIVHPAIENLQGPYTTLSYCWGGAQNSSLKTTNLQKYKDPLFGIDITNLPKTLQDAILATRRLGIRFLWVDSLCIVQDDPDDWKREAATMCHVYQNSHLTIAALKSDSSAGGLFALRNPLVYQPCWLFDDADGNNGFASLNTQIQNYMPNTLMDSPLRKRAWVFQELALSPRIIYFGDLIVWQCRKSAQTEMRCGYINTEGGGYDLHLKAMVGLTLCKDMPLSVLDSEDHKEFVVIWAYAILFYTEANLTEPNDRQVALSGVIQSVADRTGFRNFAGLWEPTFIYHLMWFNVYKGVRNGNAPSWSWLSMDGAIAYDDNISFISKFEFFQGVASLCQILVVNEEYDVGRRRTRLVGKALLFACPLKIFSILGSTCEKRDFDVVVDSLPESPIPQSKYPEVHLDCGSIPPDISNLYFLPLLLGTFGGNNNMCHQIGLMIERLTQEPEVYQRVGCLTYETDGKGERKANLERYRKTITLI